MNIGEKIKELRQRKGLTQENMAEMLKMSVTNYAYIEQGKVNPKISKLEEIAQKLETNLFELLSLNEKMFITFKQNINKAQTEHLIFSMTNFPKIFSYLPKKTPFSKKKYKTNKPKSKT